MIASGTTQSTGTRVTATRVAGSRTTPGVSPRASMVNPRKPDGVLGRRRRAGPGPHVQAEMMVIAARGHEQRARIAPQHRREADVVAVERFGLLEIGDVEMHVADAGAGVERRPRPLGARFARDIVQVQRLGGHRHLAVLESPGVARTIAIDLDPQAVGIVQIQRLAHQVIGRAGERPLRAARRRSDRPSAARSGTRMAK